METEKKFSAFLVPFLVFAVVGLTAINIYQYRIIEKQKYELRWLLAHSKIEAGADGKAAPDARPGAKDAAASQAGRPAAAPVASPATSPVRP